jgi:Tfp pilus assembly protein PilN
MKDIDFLPATYRELHRQRRATAVRLVLLFSVAVTIGVAALTQHAERRRVMARLADVQLLHKDATARQSMLADLQAQLERANAEAGLYTFLRHPWPKSKILTEIVAPLPEAITLERIEFVRLEKTTDTPAQAAFSPAQAEAAEQAPRTLPAVDDLKTLRQQAEATLNEIKLSGLTSDHAALHGYLMALGQSELLTNPQLKSVDGVQGEEETAIRFTAHVTVRPSHGLDTPRESTGQGQPEVAPAVATSNAREAR